MTSWSCLPSEMLSPMRCTKALSMVKTCQLKPRRKFQPGRGALGPFPVTYSIDRGLQHQLPIYFRPFIGAMTRFITGRVLNTGILVTILNSYKYCFCNEEPGLMLYLLLYLDMHDMQIPASWRNETLAPKWPTPKKLHIFTTETF